MLISSLSARSSSRVSFDLVTILAAYSLPSLPFTSFTFENAPSPSCSRFNVCGWIVGLMNG